MDVRTSLGFVRLNTVLCFKCLREIIIDIHQEIECFRHRLFPVFPETQMTIKFADVLGNAVDSFDDLLEDWRLKHLRHLH